MVGFAKQSTGRLIHEDGSQVGTSSMASSSGDTVVPLRGNAHPYFRNPPPAADANLKDYRVQQEAFRWLSREVMHAASTPEKAVLVHIFTMSIGMGDPAMRTTYRALECGGEWTDGLGMSRTQIYTAISGLAAKGILNTVVASSVGMEISINLAWLPATPWNERRGREVLATPKRLAHLASGSTEDTGSENRTTPIRKTELPHSENRTPYRKNQEENTLVENTILPVARSRVRPVPQISPVEEIQETIPPQTSGGDVSRSPAERVRERVEGSRRSANEAKTDHRSSIRPADVLKTWRIAFEGAYADVPGAMCPTPTREDAMKLKAAVINKWTRSPAELHDFVDFTVRNWSNMTASSFPWMKSNPPPVFPTLRFFIGQHVNVLDYWSKVRRNDWINSFDRDDQSRLLAFTLRDGLTREAALAKLGEEKAERRLREENERIRREANEKLSTALIALDRAGNQPVYGVHNPHPQSAAAKRAALGPAVPQEKLPQGAIDAAVDTFLATDFSTPKDIEE